MSALVSATRVRTGPPGGAFTSGRQPFLSRSELEGGVGQQEEEEEKGELGDEQGERHPSRGSVRARSTRRHHHPTGSTRRSGTARLRTPTVESGIISTELECGTAVLTHSFRRTASTRGGCPAGVGANGAKARGRSRGWGGGSSRRVSAPSAAGQAATCSPSAPAFVPLSVANGASAAAAASASSASGDHRHHHEPNSSQ